MVETSELAQLWRRSLDASLRYYRSLGQLTADYARAVAGTAGEVRTRGREPREPIARARAAAAGPVMALEATDGSAAVGMFMVENGTASRVSAPIEMPVLADAEGREVRPDVRFEPEVVTLEPGEQTLVQITVAVTKALAAGIDYRGEVRVPGLAGTRIPLVLRRIPAPRPARKSRRQAQKVTE